MDSQHDRLVAISSFGRALSMALDERDGATRKHCHRVVELAGSFGRRSGFDEGMLRSLRMCALFHDIGKIGIRDSVLFKDGAFDDDDWAEMRSHPERGQRIIEAIDVAGIDDIGVAVRHHHEHFDGSGYPDGLSGEYIPAVSRAVAILDAYDAMAMPRPYHAARHHVEIMEVLRREVGWKYDPYLFSSFERMIADSSRRAPDA